jgi:peptidoglycan hydrolase-like protein with peptidoglycan-binding domain/DNA invertase Pin-like site-specific DNA recombinase
MKADPSVRVRAIQHALRRRGYHLGAPGVDGRFGPLTAAAVRRFQARSGLVVDGIVGAGTRRMLVLSVRAARTHQGSPTGVSRHARRVSPLVEGVGMSRRPSVPVRRLQRMLVRNGFDVGRTGVDGRFGPLTAAAVRRLQRSFGLVPDGIVGANTQRLLGLLAGAANQPPRHSRPEGTSARPGQTPGPQRPNPVRPTPQRMTPRPVSPEQHAPAESGSTDITLAIAIAVVAVLVVTAVLMRAVTGARRRDRQMHPYPVASAVRASAHTPADESGGSPTGPSNAEPIDRHDPGAPSAEEGVEAGTGPAVNGTVVVIGYATVRAGTNGATERELRDQAETIVAECKRRDLIQLQLVREREARNGKAAERPGLGYALSRIATGEAGALIVADLSALSPSVPDLGRLLESILASGIRLIAVAQGIDTAEATGLFAVRTLIEVSGWERERLSERTRNGLRAAANGKGRPKVADDPELSARIARMRADGMTLRGIADQLNAQGVPTVRGGARWRPSSVQASAGYQRPRPANQPGMSPESNGATRPDEE